MFTTHGIEVVDLRCSFFYFRDRTATVFRSNGYPIRISTVASVCLIGTSTCLSGVGSRKTPCGTGVPPAWAGGLRDCLAVTNARQSRHAGRLQSGTDGPGVRHPLTHLQIFQDGSKFASSELGGAFRAELQGSPVTWGQGVQGPVGGSLLAQYVLVPRKACLAPSVPGHRFIQVQEHPGDSGPGGTFLNRIVWAGVF